MENIDRYEIIRPLGKGGMASVFLAKDPRFDREVAIKVLPREFMHDDTFMARFEQEARTVAKLEHNAIAPVYDYGEFEGQPYLVMRYMAGGSLKDKISNGSLSAKEILHIIQRLAQALDYAHQAGVVHRDIKPGNVLFDGQGIAYLGDFGIAKLSDSTANLTGSGIIGTPAYMSPEQVRAQEKIDGRSDVYSLGVMLFEMLVGEQPFHADTPMGVATAHLMDPVPDIREIKHDLPVKMTEIINLALEKNRDLRYQDPIALSLALENAFNAKDIPDREEDKEEIDLQSLDNTVEETIDVLDVKEEPVEVLSAPSSNWKKILSGAIGGVVLGAILLLVILNYETWFVESNDRADRSREEENSANNSHNDAQEEKSANNSHNDAQEEKSADSNFDDIQERDCGDEAILCVGLVTDVGEVDDKSFNQSAWDGVLTAETELGAIVDYIETQDAKDYEENIYLFIEDDYDVIVTVGFMMGDATAVVAAANPDVYFIGVDQFQGWGFDDDTSNDLPNYAGLIFNEDQSGFLAGALAAMLSETGTIASVLGTDVVPPVVAFAEGYELGALYINPDITVITTYHPGSPDVAFTDPGWGATTAAQAISNGADVIFGAGGKTGNGAIAEVAGHDGLYCIGVDSDQWETVPEAHNCLVSSAMKLITPGVFDLIKAYSKGNMISDNYYGGSGLAPFHDFDSMIAYDIKVLLEEIDAALKDGSLETGFSFD